MLPLYCLFAQASASAGGEEKIAMGRQLADKEFKYRCLMHVVPPLALQHCELIVIGQQRAITRIHTRVIPARNYISTAQGIHA